MHAVAQLSMRTGLDSVSKAACMAAAFSSEESASSFICSIHSRLAMFLERFRAYFRRLLRETVVLRIKCKINRTGRKRNMKTE
jgi:hypothetical protein